MEKYQTFTALSPRAKPLKILEICYLSNIPGETQFTIQITNTQAIVQLTAAEIVLSGYDFNDFSYFHAEMIRQAASGKLAEFLSLSKKEPLFKIISKKFDRTRLEHTFVIELKKNQTISRTTNEISSDKKMLFNMESEDIYDIGFTQGSESILKEKSAILLARQKSAFSEDRLLLT